MSSIYQASEIAGLSSLGFTGFGTCLKSSCRRIDCCVIVSHAPIECSEWMKLTNKTDRNFVDDFTNGYENLVLWMSMIEY